MDDAFVIKPSTPLQKGSLGKFQLGTSLNEVLNYIVRENAQSKALPKFRSVVPKFNEKNPFSSHFIIDLPAQGIELRFNSVSQQLELIRVYDLGKIILSYGSKAINGSPGMRSPTFSQTFKILGVSKPGFYSQNKECYILPYTGQQFVFHIPEQLRQEQLVVDGKAPEFDSVVLSCMHMFVPDNEDKIVPLVPADPDILILTPTGIEFPSPDEKWEPFTLGFGNTVQDVKTMLGPPQHISYKTSEHVSFHSYDEQNEYQTDYFYNYYDRGIDIFFNASTHTVRKMIFHTNLPTALNFNLYTKCIFTVSVDITDNISSVTEFFSSETRWDEIRKKIGDDGRRQSAVQHSHDNPFGPTEFYSWKNFIFEVMQRNQYLVTVTIVDPILSGP